MRSHVAKGRAARERRYESAVRRQIAMIQASNQKQTLYWYADPAEMLRRGDELGRFMNGEPLPTVYPLGAMPCGCRWQHRGKAVVFTKRCETHAVMCRSLEPWELDLVAFAPYPTGGES